MTRNNDQSAATAAGMPPAALGPELRIAAGLTRQLEPVPHVKPGPEPLLATVGEAGKLLRCGKTTIFDLINRGLLERRKLGRATRITLASIRKIAGV